MRTIFPTPVSTKDQNVLSNGTRLQKAGYDRYYDASLDEDDRDLVSALH